MLEREIFNPRQLTSARVARGITIKDLAEKSDVSRQAVSGYESGKATPKIDTMLRIAASLEFPLDYFYEESTMLPQSTTYFRKRTAATSTARKMQEERLVFAVKVYQKLTNYVNIPDVLLPESLNLDVHEISDELIDEKAMELRKVWQLDSISPIDNIISLAEKNGIIVVEANMSNDKLDAVSRWYKDRPFVMLTDNSESAVRRRFNVAHELGHIILHSGIESYDHDNIETKEIERQAHLFASKFLMPDKAFMTSLLSTSLDYYVELKSYWKVSIQAMVSKTYYLKLINEDRRLYLNKQISFKKWRKREPLDDVIKIERPSLNKKVFQMIINNNVKTKRELISEFNLPLDELSKIIGIEFDSKKKASLDTTPSLRLI